MFITVKKSFSILSLLLIGQQSLANDYKQLFGNRYTRAEKTAAEVRPVIQKYAKAFGEDSDLMEAIIFPELIRYNALYDAIETGSLIGLYARFGYEYADFSIGLFQMKPTFALSIETEVMKHKQSRWVKLLGFDKISLADEPRSRLARVDRLENVEWQVKYLVAMLKCLKLKNSRLTLTAEDRVLFTASAYNCGWDKSATVIKSYISKKHYQPGYWEGEKYAFADVALYRYADKLKNQELRIRG
ncbi:hypothetical protein DJ568_05725 [Mucilaginibacter hurinus]|uniref:Transglycosylase SLT domain-containing protein n=1 Tax=Mucilaginibacter hurinus TaxID=2201324 RepID=A0A367GS06_9SPHI|nr:hypothetical protein [Mucilaginibacter hurinus]RCH56232.1 hypothetical protein DJ568_05725 [Mucilaginibacter hurinus]